MKLCDSCVFLWQKTVTALWSSFFTSENVAFDYKSKKDVNHIYIFNLRKIQGKFKCHDYKRFKA